MGDFLSVERCVRETEKDRDTRYIQKVRPSQKRALPLGKATQLNLGKEIQVHSGAIMQTLRYSITVNRKGRDGLTGTKMTYQLSKE